MKKSWGFSLLKRGDQLVSLGVSQQGQTLWRIELLSRNSAEGGPPTGLARAMSRSPETVTWLVPNELTRISLTTFPRLGTKEMRRAMAGWVAREEGNTPDDWSISSRVISEPGKRSGKDPIDEVFLLYAPRHEVEAILEQSLAWGFDPGRLLPGFLALDAFYRKVGPESQSIKAWNLVFVGEQDRFLCVSTDRSQLLNRPLPVDLSDGADTGEYVARLATEVERSGFFARQTEFSSEVERTIVCGDPNLAGPLVEKLNQDSSIPAVHWQVEKHFEWGGHPFDADLLVPLAGAALGLRRIPFNLKPAAGRTLINKALQKKLALVAGAVIGPLVPLLLVGGVLTTQIQDRYLDRARQHLQTATEKATRAEEVYRAQQVLQAKQEQIRRFAGTLPDLEAVLLRLASLTPGRVLLRSLEINEKPDGKFTLNIQGESEASTAVAAHESFLELLDSLSACDFLVPLDEPSALNITAQGADGRGSKKTIFSLDYQLVPPGEGREG